MKFTGDMRLWAVGEGVVLHVLHTLHEIHWRYADLATMTFSPDNKLLAAKSPTGPIDLWDVANGVHLYAIDTDYQLLECAISFSPDGNLLATAASGTLTLWDVGPF
jgi:WD40 repeat protein